MPDVLDGRTYEIDETTGIRRPIDVEATRENLNQHMPILVLLDLFTHIAPPTAGDLVKFSNKFVECLHIYKAMATEHASQHHVGK